MAANPKRNLPRPLLLSAIAAGIFVTSACRQEAEPMEDNNAVEADNGLIPSLPAEILPLDRAALLDAVAKAASAHAAGLDDRADQNELGQQRFAVRIPFGCPAGSAPLLDGALRLAVRPNGKAYVASATPDIDLADLKISPEEAAKQAASGNAAPPPAPSTAAKIEAAEGFWIPRPWLRTPNCPDVPITLEGPSASDKTTQGANAPPATEEPPAPDHTVGIVQYYDPDDSRVGYRSGRAYSKIQPIRDNAPAPATGALMLLEGRLRPWPDGRVIRCVGDDPAARPTCFVSASVDRVAFERIDNGELIAEWRR